MQRARDAAQAFRHGRVIEMTVGPEHDQLVQGLPAERWDSYSWNTTWGLRTIDDLVQSKGVAIYREMPREDPNIASCIYLMVMARLSSGWDFLPASDAPEDKRSADWMRTDMDRLVSRLVSDLMEAVWIGFSCIEKVWDKPRTSGEWAGFQGYRTFRPLPQETVTFKRDEHGDLEPDGVWQCKSDHPGSMVPPGLDPGSFNKFDASRFVKWYWRTEYGNPLGLSVLRAAYAPYFFKKLATKHWARYMAKFGLPGIRVRVPANATKEQMDDAVEYARRYQTDLAMAYREGTVIETETPNTTATMNYEAAIAYANKEEAHACLQPSTMLDAPENGSYLLGREHTSTFTMTLDNIGRLIEEEAIGSQIIRPSIDTNFGPQYECPRFKFRDFSQKDMESFVRMVDLAVRAGVSIPQSWVKETIGAPEVKDEADRLIPPAASSPTPPVPSLPVAASGDPDLDALVAEFMAARMTNDKDRGCAALLGIK